MKAAAWEIGVTMLNEFVPVGDLLACMGADATDKESLIGPGQSSEQDGGAQLERSTADLRHPDQYDVSRLH
jgi:hypothetical protein